MTLIDHKAGIIATAKKAADLAVFKKIRDHRRYKAKDCEKCAGAPSLEKHVVAEDRDLLDKEISRYFKLKALPSNYINLMSNGRELLDLADSTFENEILRLIGEWAKECRVHRLK